MGEQETKRAKKNICAGLLAHVDAGKTTLSEAILYISGTIRRLGRVDHKDAYLDTYELERERGITIFSKQAVVDYEDIRMTLLDTPGHVDFSAEMERSLQVLDAAVLVINGADGVQGHTQTLWRLLKRYRIPVFLFINKMDQQGTDQTKLLTVLKERLAEECIDFGEADREKFFENLALCDEAMMDRFLEKGTIEQEEIGKAVMERKVFPCYFGSALKLWGVEELLQGIKNYAGIPSYPEPFGAKIFKISRDEQGNRLTHLKITGGILRVKAVLSNQSGKSHWEEKVNQIRIYSGNKFETVNEAAAGCVCAVTGLTKTYPGQGLGIEEASEMPLLEPVLNYRIGLPEGCEPAAAFVKLRQLEEEDPLLHMIWNESLKEIQTQVMGEVQIEILKSLIEERFGMKVTFDTGNIVYKETIADTVEGVGHFEPLRHYAEVHLLLEPGEPGSGLQFFSECSEDVLSRNWQRLVLTHLEEREHIGILTGSPVTDMKITLTAGKAHLKHTEGGDFRQATYRAVRQGLMQAGCVLLEPFYEYRLEVPENAIGRAMTDIEKMCGTFFLEQKNDGSAVLTGEAPVTTMRDYQKELTAYTKGHGRLFCSLKGYAPCHNAEEVIERIGYEPDRDLENPAGSVFCAHGAGFTVPWNQVKDWMHLESTESRKKELNAQVPEHIWEQELLQRKQSAFRQKDGGKEREKELRLGTDEIDAIISSTSYANSRKEGNRKQEGWKRESTSDSARVVTFGEKNVRKKQEKKEEYLLVDGYNVIFAWEDLKELAEINLDSARGKLLDILSNYQGMKQCHLIVVFDAYRLQGHQTEVLDYHNIHVVYTKEAETADQYIEKFAHENGSKYQVTVATSDGLEQIIIRGQGCRLLSARDLQEEVRLAGVRLQEEFLERQQGAKNYLLDYAGEAVLEELEQQRKQPPTNVPKTYK